MERVLHTVLLPDGLPLDICECLDEVLFAGETVPELIAGLKFVRVAGGRITLPEAHDLLTRTGHTDVIALFKIPAY